MSKIKKKAIFLDNVVTYCCLILGPSAEGQYFTYNHSNLKEPEILRKIIYCLKYDKTGVTPFYFSGPELQIETVGPR